MTKSYMPLLVYEKQLITARAISPEIGHLAELAPLVFLRAIAFDYLIVVVCMSSYVYFPNPGVWFVCWLIIGARQHGLGILMHDVGHFNFLRDKQKNDFWGNILVTFPLMFISTEAYRKKHRAHHNFVGTQKDPDLVAKQDMKSWHFPKTPWQLLLLALQMLSGWGFFLLMRHQIRAKKNLTKGEEEPKDHRVLKQKIVYWIVLACLITAVGGWKIFLLLWLVPILSSLIFFERVRSVAEHFAVENEHDFNYTRSVDCNAINKFLFGPHNIHYHIEHHIYPMVPFYNLPKLSTLLRAQPEFTQNCHISQNYVGFRSTALIRELVRGPRSHVHLDASA